MTITPTLDFSSLLELRDYACEFSTMDSDFVYSHFSLGHKPPSHKFPSPIRVHGLACFLSIAGETDIEVDLTHYHLASDTLLVVSRNSLINFASDHDARILDAHLLFLSETLIHDINIDLNVLQQSVRPDLFSHPPVCQLSPQESRLLQSYLSLIHANATQNQDPVIQRSIMRALTSALLYQLLHITRRFHSNLSPDPTPERAAARYLHQFMDLLHREHCSHRQLAFYASSLFITPKYLSRLVAQATGRPATAWIDDFVILEAKNLLRFSGQSIQQTAQTLGFPDQSSFGKYFKKLTGLTPSQYQRS